MAMFTDSLDVEPGKKAEIRLDPRFRTTSNGRSAR